MHSRERSNEAYEKESDLETTEEEKKRIVYIGSPLSTGQTTKMGEREREKEENRMYMTASPTYRSPVYDIGKIRV